MFTATSLQPARKWMALGAACLCVLAVTLDTTVLSLALPKLARTLHASEADLQWFVTAYLLVMSASALPIGFLGDRFGRRRLLLAAIALFGAGSAACAYAPSVDAFVAARVVLGLAGAGVIVMAMSALTVLFDDAERSTAVGVYEAANFLALPLGPLLGGWMLDRFWWGWLFLINIPVVLAALMLVWLLVPETRADKLPGLDWTGVGLSAAGLVALTYGLVGAGERGWANAVPVTALVAGAALLFGFLSWESRLSRAPGRRPLLDMQLLGSPSFKWGSILSATPGLALIGLMFAVPQYLQAILGLDALGAGLMLLPLVVGLAAGAVPSGRLAQAVGAKFATAGGFTLVVLGFMVGVAVGDASSPLFVGTWLAIVGAGVGLAMSTGTAAALANLTPEKSGIGMAAVQAVQKVSAPLGTAIMGSVLSAGYQAHLALGSLPASAAGEVRKSVFSGLNVAERLGSNALHDAVQAAFIHGLRVTFAASAAIAVLGLLLTLSRLPGRRTPKTTREVGG